MAGLARLDRLCFGLGSMEREEVEEAYRRLWPLIRAKCARMLKDVGEAEDVAQETFQRLCSTNMAKRDALALTAWIYRTSTRLAIDRMRRMKPELDPDVDAEESGAEARAIARSELRALAATIPESELAVIVLCRVDGLSQQEAAEVVGSSERTVRRLLKRFDERREVRP